MKDLIERQVAIDSMANAIWHYPNECYRYLNSYECAKRLVELCLSGLPSAQPDYHFGWIPCSERLPEDEYVLISKIPTKISGSKWSVAIAIRTADPRSRKIQWRDSGFGIIQDDKVLAWMPLPEPYQGEGEMDED